ncbi:hypothetical protein P5673_024831 [Acropora cervicornis]|uniref:Uncharacterized protein n=1 Tax=Acropora cervicornis TaxID=6130 RepID=A0AAD9Q319_ACRCE|nr:hypothetical protein P5673_024831 [Acropora cervicornis]
MHGMSHLIKWLAVVTNGQLQDITYRTQMRKYYESSMATYSGRSYSLVAKIAAETTASDLVLEETAPENRITVTVPPLKTEG